MYLVLFLNQRNYEFITSLHSSLPSAEAAYKALLLRFGIKQLEGGGLCDHWGQEPHIYRIECDGKPGEEISVSDIKLEAMLGLRQGSLMLNDADATAYEESAS